MGFAGSFHMQRSTCIIAHTLIQLFELEPDIGPLRLTFRLSLVKTLLSYYVKGLIREEKERENCLINGGDASSIIS